MHIFKKIIILLAIPYFLLVGCLYYFQRDFLYFPQKNTPQEISEFALKTGFKRHKIKSHDGLELTSLYKEGNRNKPLILIFNGNAGSIYNSYDMAAPLIKQDHPILINIYRGYGANKGTPSEENFLRDAEALYQSALSLGYKKEEIIPYGYSLGSAMAVYLASTHPETSKLILKGSFSSVKDVAQGRYFFAPVGLLIKDPYPSEERIQNVTAKILFLHGEKDKIVPLKYGEKLYQAAQSPKDFIRYPNGTHGNLWDMGANAEIVTFVQQPL